MENDKELTRQEIETLMDAFVPLVRQTFKAYDKFKDTDPRLPSPPQNLREAENDLRQWGVPMFSLQCIRRQEQTLTEMKTVQDSMATVQTAIAKDSSRLTKLTIVLIVLTAVLAVREFSDFCSWLCKIICHATHG